MNSRKVTAQCVVRVLQGFCERAVAAFLRTTKVHYFEWLQRLLYYFVLVCFANHLSTMHFLRGQRGQNHWAPYWNGTCDWLWCYGWEFVDHASYSPILTRSHFHLSCCDNNCKCPTASFPVLCAWPYRPA